MPSSTFLNLDKKKQELFLKISMQEFTARDFNSASVSEIVRVMNIAKGSVYQYFNDKIDLYFYLIDLAFSEKLKYLEVESAKVDKSFPAWLKTRQELIASFDKKKSIYSKLLRSFYLQKNNPLLRKKYLELKKTELQMMMQQMDKYSDVLRKNIDKAQLAALLLELPQVIEDYPEVKEGKKLTLKSRGAVASTNVTNGYIDILSKGIVKTK